MSDFFDEMRKYMNKRFTNFFDDEWFGFDEDPFFKTDIDRNWFNKWSSKNTNDGKSKEYSISYKYETGMDAPEIRYSGDIDEKEVNKFVERINKRTFGQKTLPTSKRLMLNSYEPFVDINEYDKMIKVIFEIPGVREEDIDLKVNKGSIEITAKTYDKDRTYHKSLELPAKVHKKVVSKSYKNGVLELELKKK